MSSLTECAPISPDYTMAGTDHTWRSAWTDRGWMRYRGSITPFREVIAGFESSNWPGTTCHLRRKVAYKCQRCRNGRQQHRHSYEQKMDAAATLALTPVETRLLVRIHKKKQFILKEISVERAPCRKLPRTIVRRGASAVKLRTWNITGQFHLLAEPQGPERYQATGRSGLRAVLRNASYMARIISSGTSSPTSPQAMRPPSGVPHASLRRSRPRMPAQNRANP
jgi:hypothetical protein